MAEDKNQVVAELIFHDVEHGLRVDVATFDDQPLRIDATKDKPRGVLLINGQAVGIFFSPALARQFGMQIETTRALAMLYEATCTAWSAGEPEKNTPPAELDRVMKHLIFCTDQARHVLDKSTELQGIGPGPAIPSKARH